MPTELSNSHKQNDDFAFQIYGGCALAEGILKVSYQTNISGQPCKNTFDNIYAMYQRIALLSVSSLPGSILINGLKKHETSRLRDKTIPGL